MIRRKLNNEYCLRGNAYSEKEAYIVIFKLRNIYETVDNTCCLRLTSLEVGNQGICLIMLFYLTTCLAHPKMTVFLLYFEAQQRKRRGLEGKEEGEEEEEEREEGEMVSLGRKCRNINIGTRMAGTMFIFHVYKLYILIPVLQSWSACSISIIYIVYAQYILQDVFPPLLWVCINLFICVMYVLF